MEMIDTASLSGPDSISVAGEVLTDLLLEALSITEKRHKEGFDE
jgi:lipoyl(octanoyl) transferase